MKKSIVGLLALISIGAQASSVTVKGESTLYTFPEGTASILLKGAPAEELYQSLNVPVKFLRADVDYNANLKKGKNVSCYERTDTREVQCVISVADLAAGSIR